MFVKTYFPPKVIQDNYQGVYATVQGSLFDLEDLGGRNPDWKILWS